jgi:hypothetical protein
MRRSHRILLQRRDAAVCQRLIPDRILVPLVIGNA